MTETTARWQGIARGIAEQLGQQMVLEAGSAALVGHRVKLDAGEKDRTDGAVHGSQSL